MSTEAPERCCWHRLQAVLPKADKDEKRSGIAAPFLYADTEQIVPKSPEYSMEKLTGGNNGANKLEYGTRR